VLVRLPASSPALLALRQLAPAEAVRVALAATMADVDRAEARTPERGVCSTAVIDDQLRAVGKVT
jgi:hypothetical protein